MSFAPANANFEGVVRKLLLGMPYLQWLSLSFVHIAPGEVDFAMPLRREITFDGKSVEGDGSSQEPEPSQYRVSMSSR
jgi:acyl-coenzyme A thioesterase PaaI-like protein